MSRYYFTLVKISIIILSSCKRLNLRVISILKLIKYKSLYLTSVNTNIYYITYIFILVQVAYSFLSISYLVYLIVIITILLI